MYRCPACGEREKIGKFFKKLPSAEVGLSLVGLNMCTCGTCSYKWSAEVHAAPAGNRYYIPQLQVHNAKLAKKRSRRAFVRRALLVTVVTTIGLGIAYAVLQSVAPELAQEIKSLFEWRS